MRCIYMWLLLARSEWTTALQSWRPHSCRRGRLRLLPNRVHPLVGWENLPKTIARRSWALEARKGGVVDVAAPEGPYHLVIVESPSKCGTIEKILTQYAQTQGLGHAFCVTSCMGHIRNLPSKDDAETKVQKAADSSFPYPIAGIDLNHQYRPTYTIIPGKEGVVRELRKLAGKASKVLLATDPDREGEAMAWHLQQVLGDTNSYERISFTEITPAAVVQAVTEPVALNPGLVQAQETRRIVDRLAGFTVSPLLWKKIAPGLSAGRVQSVGLGIVVKRERERLLFEPTSYWSVHADVTAAQGNLTAQLYSVGDQVVASSGQDFTSQGRRLATAASHKRHILEDGALGLANRFREETTEWTVFQVKATTRQQQPPQPYRTSTLQQDVNRRLGLSIQQCMRTAQQLYEQGLISYMRTDATYLSEDAESSLKKAIVASYGEDMYERREGASSKRKKESKFAQEAHEAIRPAIQPDGKFLNPTSVDLPGVAKDLYRMIFQRTLACRMPNLVTNLTQISIEATTSDGLTSIFRTSGSVVLSPGYTSVYGTINGREDPEKRELPALTKGEKVDNTKVETMPHETQPPPRYTEASFVKELEALGVGRPSTYAGIITLLRERAYVGSPVTSQANRSKKDVSGPAISAHRAAGGDQFTGASKGPLVPSLPAFAVCSLLEKHCPTYVDSKFTAQMEERLDSIANSEQSSEEERLTYLNEFYAGDEGLAAVVKRIGESVGGEEFRRVRLPALESSEATSSLDEEIRLLVGPWGPYVQRKGMNGDEAVTAPLPSSMAADLSTITTQNLQSLLLTKESGGHLLGVHPEDGRSVRLKTGRFGAYLQWGDDGEPGTSTHSLPHNLPVFTSDSNGKDDSIGSDYPVNMPILTFEDALGYVSLPKTVSELHNNPIVASIGPYGPYLKYNNTYVNLEKDQNVLSIDAETAEGLVVEALASGGRKKPRGTLAELGEKEGNMVRVKSGRFGKYISWKKTNAKLPDTYIDSFPSLDDAWTIICDKRTTSPVQTQKGAKKKVARGVQASSVKLPPQPKRPLSAYLLFSMANRPKLAKQKLSLGESSKVLSKMWSDLSLEEKVQYDAAAIDNKSKYEEEKKSWQAECQSLLEGAKGTSSKMKSLKDSKRATPNSSKRIRRKSAYIFFCQEHRPDVASRVNSLGEISKELARLWRETADRSKYEDLAAEDKLRCEQNNSAFDDPLSPNTRTPKQTQSVQQKRAKRTPSAYMLFCKEFRSTIVDADENKLPLGETTKRLAVLWKSCDTATRERFAQLALEGKEQVFLVA